MQEIQVFNDCPSTLLYLPASHSVQSPELVNAAFVVNLPAGQFSQFPSPIAPLDGPNLPAGQSLQSEIEVFATML
jgi:hypothetical protein